MIIFISSFALTLLIPSSKKTKETVPMGLVGNWREKVGEKAKGTNDSGENSPLGSLADSDAEGIPPPKTLNGRQKAHGARQNDVSVLRVPILY